MIASALRVRLKSYRYYIPFLIETVKVFNEIDGAEGFAGASALVDRNRTFWVVSVWEDGRTMSAFYKGGAHAAAMPVVPRWCDEAIVVSWKTDERAVPTFEECYRMMLEKGRLTEVDDPSPRHETREFPPPGPERLFNVRRFEGTTP